MTALATAVPPAVPTALLADDEEGPREQLRAALQQAWPELQLLAVVSNGVDAWDAYLEHEPDVCFLDIRMPGLSGIEVARRIAGRAQVVFVSAYDDQALAAFDAGAVDYVLKPVRAERLARAVQRFARACLRAGTHAGNHAGRPGSGTAGPAGAAGRAAATAAAPGRAAGRPGPRGAFDPHP